MKERFLLFCFIALMATVAFTSCKKEEEEETPTKLSMSGSVQYSVPAFVHKNSSLTMSASGITRPGNIEYKWFIGSLYKDTLNAQTITVHFPDSVARFIITAIATCPEYYNSTNTAYVSTIDTTLNESLKGLKYGTSIIDPRDGQRYFTVKIGALEWFAQNLAWAGSGVPYQKSPSTHSLFGRFYSWSDATGGVSAGGLGAGPQGVCPKGWSIPTVEDWEDLAKALNGGKALPFVNDWNGLADFVTAPASFNGDQMWPYSPDQTQTNTSGWNAIPMGNTQFAYSLFRGYGEYAFFWSATQKNNDQAYYRYIYYDKSSFPMNFTSKDDFGASVRCVRVAE